MRHDLPVGIHVGGVTGLPSASGGWPSYYFEEHQSHPVAAGALLASLVFNGVFEAFPLLRVICIEASFGWAPSLCWRLDRQWERLRAEVPHLKRSPSDYIRVIGRWGDNLQLFLISDMALAKIPDEHLDAVMKTFREAGIIEVQSAEDLSANVLDSLREQPGVTVTEVDTAPFAEALRHVQDEVAKELKVENLLEIIRSKE